MSRIPDERRRFLKTAVLGGAAAASGTLPAGAANAQSKPRPADAKPAGYQFFRPAEAAFVEALVDHMVPADKLSPSGTGLGINVFIDRALAGGWGQGERLYRQGPWKRGVPSQGYQLPLTPAELYRTGIEATNAYCVKTYKRTFERLDAEQKEQVLLGLESGKVDLGSSLPAREFFAIIYQTVMEGMFSDPVYGGNVDKAGWKMVGFPGVVANHSRNIVAYKNKRYTEEPQGISDLS